MSVPGSGWPGEGDEQNASSEVAESDGGADEQILDESVFEEGAEVSADEVDQPAEEAQVAEDEDVPDEDTEGEPLPPLRLAGHAPGELDLPDDVSVLEGFPAGGRRGVGIVASRFNGEITNRLLVNAFAELERAGVARDVVTVVPVPGAFELPLAAMALAKTRRFSCIVALGCVIRGETAHFEYVAGEAASGLQLAALETGVPVSFGVLTVETIEQAWERVDKGAEAVRTALEMADLFTKLRNAAQHAGSL